MAPVLHLAYFPVYTKALNLILKQLIMAITNNPAWKGFKGTSGTVSKSLVFKNYEDKTVLSKYPDMTQIKRTDNQVTLQNRFKEAVRFAKEIISDPIKKATYPVAKGKTVYHTAIKDFLATLQV